MTQALKRILATVLVAVLISTAFVVQTSASMPAGDPTNFYEQLTPTEKEIYDHVATTFLGNIGADLSGPFSLSTPITIPNTSAGDAVAIEAVVGPIVTRALDAFRYDHPEVFWINNSTDGGFTSIQIGADVVIPSLDVGYGLGTFDGTDQPTIDSIVSQIVSSASSHPDRYTQLKTVHDMIAARVFYLDRNSDRDHEVSGGLVDRQGVCETYAKSFKLVCDQLGIPSLIIGGTSTNPNKVTPENHMWNYVEMDDGNWYAVDITWDDQVDKTYYDYFLVGSSTLAPNFGNVSFSSAHTPSASFLSSYPQFDLPTLAANAYPVPSTGAGAPTALDYVVAPKPTVDGWYNMDIKLTSNGYSGYTLISNTNTGTGQNALTISQETPVGTTGSETLYMQRPDGTWSDDFQFVYRLDKTPPVSLGFSEGVGTIEVLASDDNSGIKSITLKDPNGNLCTLTSNWIFTATIQGNYTAVITDNANNVTALPFISTLQPVGPITGGGSSGSKSGSSGSRGGGGGGGMQQDGITSTSGASAPTTITVSEAETLATKALKLVGTGNTANVSIKKSSKTIISKDALLAISKKSDAAGKNILVTADSVNGKTIVLRLTIDPSKTTKDIALTGSVTNAAAKKAATTFAKLYRNPIATIAFDQTGTFGMTVKVSAKLDLSKFSSTNNLCFYGYDPAQKSYVRISTAYSVNSSGYVTFETPLAGNIIVSDGPLTK